MHALLKTLFSLRDAAVHPSSKLESAIYSPIIGSGLPATYHRFRAENATRAVHQTRFIHELADLARDSEPKVNKWAAAIQERLPADRPAYDVPGDV
jgi:hypothetical protein